jgi:hypothetical protein
MIDRITSAEATAMRIKAASARCRGQQGALRPIEWSCIYSAYADKSKSDEEKDEPVHFPSGCSCADENITQASDNILQSRLTAIVVPSHGWPQDDASFVNLKHQA